MSGNVWYSRGLIVLLLVAGLPLTSVCQMADASQLASSASASDLYLKVQLTRAPKFYSLRAGDMLDGSLTRDVYSGEQKIFPAGSTVRLTVDHLEKKKRPANDHWPWIVQVFTPRHISYPVFTKATITSAQKESHPLNVSLISASAMREVHAEVRKSKSATPAVEVRSRTKNPGLTLILQAESVEAPPSPLNNEPESATSDGDPGSPNLIPAGTRCKLLLLNSVSASKSRVGDEVAARLLDPVFLNSRVVLPAGAIFTGKVAKKTPPRRLSRAGSLELVFTGLTLPQGMHLPISASLSGAELDQKSHTRMDSEGQLHGEHPGKAWLALNLGVTAGISKGVDDGAQLLIEALVSSATDVSTAGTARIVSSCASGIYMATRHGRDVILPRFTEMEVSLDRAVSLIAPTKTQLALVSSAAEK